MIATTRKRESGIELSKIIAMFLIIICHCIAYICNNESFSKLGLTYSTATREQNSFIFQIIRYAGQIGNLMFFIPTCWFLVDKAQVKKNKISSMIGDCFFVSIVILIVLCLLGIDVSRVEKIKSILPITFANNWYITCYILLYMISPLINLVINNITRKQHFNYIAIYMVLYCGINFIVQGLFFYSDIVGMVGIYFIVAYLKRYNLELMNNKKFNIVLLALASLLAFAMQFATNLLGLKVGVLSDKVLHWWVFYNPVLMLIALSVFNLFRKLELKSGWINYISSLTMIMYITHNNFILKKYVLPDVAYKVWEMLGKINVVLYLFVFATGLFIVVALAAIVYNTTLQRLVHKIVEKVMNLVVRLHDRVVKMLINSDKDQESKVIQLDENE